MFLRCDSSVGTCLYNDTHAVLSSVCPTTSYSSILRAILALLVHPLYHLKNNEPRNITLGCANDISPRQCMFRYMHMCVPCTCTHPHRETHNTYSGMHDCRHTHTCTHAHAHTHAHTHTHTHIHAHPVARTYAQCAGTH